MPLASPPEKASIDPEVQVSCRLFGVAVSVVIHPSSHYCVEGAELEKRFVSKSLPGGYLLPFGFQARLSLATGCDQQFRVVMSTHLALNVLAQQIKTVIHRGNLRLFYGKFELQFVLEERLNLIPSPTGFFFAAIGQQEPIVRVADEGTVPLVFCPTAFLDLAMEIAVLVPPVAIKLMQVHICQQRRANGPLWDTQFGVPKESILHQTCFKEAGHEAKEPSISNAFCQALQHDVVLHVIERSINSMPYSRTRKTPGSRKSKSLTLGIRSTGAIFP